MGRLLWILVAAALLAQAAPASACSAAAAGQTARERLRAADLAVYGRVVAVRDRRSSASVTVVVRVWRIYKGRAGRTIELRHTPEPDGCDRPFAAGDRVGLLLDRPSPYSADGSSRIKLEALHRAAQRRFRRPPR